MEKYLLNKNIQISMKIMGVVEELSKVLPKFPDGRINYSESDKAPVITVFVMHNDDLLLLKRSDNVSTYEGKWNVVAGFLDDFKPVEEKVFEELKEELDIDKTVIKDINFGKQHEVKDNDIGKIWVVQPVLVKLKEKPEVKLDWEHDECTWIKKDELNRFDVVPGLEKGFENLFR